jgi:hypothetical protein
LARRCAPTPCRTHASASRHGARTPRTRRAAPGAGTAMRSKLVAALAAEGPPAAEPCASRGGLPNSSRLSRPATPPPARWAGNRIVHAARSGGHTVGGRPLAGERRSRRHAAVRRAGRLCALRHSRRQPEGCRIVHDLVSAGPGRARCNRRRRTLRGPRLLASAPVRGACDLVALSEAGLYMASVARARLGSQCLPASKRSMWRTRTFFICLRLQPSTLPRGSQPSGWPSSSGRVMMCVL